MFKQGDLMSGERRQFTKPSLKNFMWLGSSQVRPRPFW